MICTSSSGDGGGPTSGFGISHGFDDDSASCTDGSDFGADFDILLLLSSGVRDRLCVRLRLPLTKLLELLLERLQESTTSTETDAGITDLGVSMGLDSGAGTVGAAVAGDEDVEGFGDSTRAIWRVMRTGELGVSGETSCFWLAVALVTAPMVRTRFGDDVAAAAVVGESELTRVVGVVPALPLLPGEVLLKLILGPLLLAMARTSDATIVLVAIVVVGLSFMVVFRAGLDEVGVLVLGISGVLAVCSCLVGV